MQSNVKIGQDLTLVSDRPRAPGHRRHHVGALDAFHDEIETVVTRFLDDGRRKALGPDVLHNLSLQCHRAPLARAPEHESSAVLEDVSVATGRQ